MHSNFRPIHLLLVEDNILNQKLIYLNLCKLGFTLDIANNGLEAVEKCTKNQYDLVLMDLMMPVMDGFEATLHIRELDHKKHVHTCIIGLTANTLDADRDRCLQHGMDEYLAKPFDIKDFKRVLFELKILKEDYGYQE